MANMGVRMQRFKTSGERGYNASYGYAVFWIPAGGDETVRYFDRHADAKRLVAQLTAEDQ